MECNIDSCGARNGFLGFAVLPPLSTQRAFSNLPKGQALRC